jgi:hypothetical protein
MIGLPPAAAMEPGTCLAREREVSMLSVLIGIIVVIVAVVEWFGHITIIHALAILTLIVGISILLTGVGERGARYTRF